jgi:hypothetical protein
MRPFAARLFAVNSIFDTTSRFVGRSLAVGVMALLTPLAAHAQDTPADVRAMPIRAWTPPELEVVRSLADRYVVAHIEPTEQLENPQVTVGARVQTSCENVLAVVRDVGAYERFMPAMDTVAVDATAPDLMSYTWTWQAAIFSFHGRSTVSVVGDGTRGFRAVFEMVDGDLGQARRSLRAIPEVTPQGPACLLTLGAHHDFRDANYIARESQGSVPTMSRSLNLVLSIALVTRLRGEAEHRAGFVRPRIVSPLGDPRRDLDPAAYQAILWWGDMYLFETSDGTDLGACIAMTRFVHEEPRVRHAFIDVTTFTQGLLYGATITEVAHHENDARYAWNVDLPFLGSSGQMAIRNLNEHDIEMEAVEGAMRGGRMLLSTAPAFVGSWVTLSAQLDPADGVPIVRAIESTDSAFRPGLVASGMLMAFRGLRRGLAEGH